MASIPELFADGAEVKFVRTPSGTVHVLRPVEDEQAEVAPITSGAAFADALLVRTPMVCGLRLLIDHLETGAGAQWVNDFADLDLCELCVRGMGAESWRAFDREEHGPPQRRRWANTDGGTP